MSGHSHQRLLVTAAVTILFLLAAAAAVSASPGSPADKEPSATFDAQAVVVGPVGSTPYVFVATGANFPDALGAGPAAAIDHAPILLVTKDSIPEATGDALDRLHPSTIYVVGGTAVISNSVQQQLGVYAPHVERLAGTNRYETAAKVSEAAFPAAHAFTIYDTSNLTIPITTSCTAYDGLTLPVTVPGPGTIVVDANVNLRIDHTTGAEDTTFLRLVTSPTDCSTNGDFGGDLTYADVAAELPTSIAFPWVTMTKIIHVPGPSTTTFSVTGLNAGNPNSTRFYHAYIHATYTPDPGA